MSGLEHNISSNPSNSVIQGDLALKMSKDPEVMRVMGLLLKGIEVTTPTETTPVDYMRTHLAVTYKTSQANVETALWGCAGLVLRRFERESGPLCHEPSLKKFVRAEPSSGQA